MQTSLLPPGSTSKVRAQSVLVLAPHFDDEVLGCGGLIASLASEGSVVRVLFLSDSAGGVEQIDDPAEYARRRQQEARAAIEALGLQGFDQLGLPDGALGQHLDDLAQGIRRALLSQRPDLVLVTSPLEITSDHRAAFRALHDVLASSGDFFEAGDFLEDLEVLAYEVNHPLYPNLLVDVSSHTETLKQAMGHYSSQQERHDYLGACLGLRRYRALSLGPEVESVEAYRRLTLSDFKTHGPSRLIKELGGRPELLKIEEGPLVSVIVRTKDRPEHLAEALASLAESTYRNVEVIVVNDGGTQPELPETYPLTLRAVNLEINQGRAEAANAGVQAAQGDYVAFLDDDDLVEPEHLATLVGLVSGAGVRVAYTDAAVGVYETDPEEGWTCTERRLPYSRDFDPELLLCDNYIPFHTLLIERGLFEEAGGFDPAFESFEDWDFLIRLATLTPFQHLARVTCEYRHFRGSGHHILGDRPRQRGDFLANKSRVLSKHSSRLQPDVLARVIDGLRAEAIEQQDASQHWRAESRRFEGRSHALNGQLNQLENFKRVLETSLERAESSLQHSQNEGSQLRSQLHERDREVQRLFSREADLTAEIAQQSQVLEEQFQKLAEFYKVSERQTAELERLYEREKTLAGREEELLRHVEELRGHAEEQGTELQRVYQQEQELNDHLGRTYAEIERLNQLIETMKQTRGWRLQEWWEKHRR